MNSTQVACDGAFGYRGVAAALLAEVGDECARRPRLAFAGFAAAPDAAPLVAAAGAVDAAFAFRELHAAADVVAPLADPAAASGAVALALRPARGACAPGAADLGAVAALAARRGGRDLRVASLAAAAAGGPPPAAAPGAAAYAPCYFAGDGAPSDRRDGVYVLEAAAAPDAAARAAAGPGLFWARRDRAPDDGAPAAARLRAAGPAAAAPLRDLATSCAKRTGAAKAAAARAGVDADQLADLTAELLALADTHAEEA